MQKAILEPAQNIPVVEEADVIVVGGGPAGIAAAVTARRSGAKKVVLLERYGHLGGMATGGIVVLIPHLSTGSQIEQAGMNVEWLERLAKKPGGVIGTSKEDVGSSKPELINLWKKYFSFVWADLICYGAYVDPEILKIVLNEMVEEANVDVYLHSWGCRALVKDDEVTGVVFESKEGRKAVLGKIVIDCTGDGDIFASAGAAFDLDPNKDIRNCMMALVYRIGNVDFQAFAEYKSAKPEDWAKKVQKIHEIAGFRTLPFPTPRNDVMWVNNWIPGRDCLKVKDLTAVEFEVRRTALPVIDYLKKEVPGFNESSFLHDTAPQVGTRGSRRLKGEYKVIYDDIKQTKKHDDVISVVPAIDLSVSKSATHIPYRALVPEKINNLLVAGRCFSSDVEANNWTNLIPHCITLGQAAGAAAAIALDSNVQPRKVDIKALQKTLRSQGVYLP
ncbi:FAD-dependent oxidoreductase [Sporomusa malonica]|uniref:FAD dependent oxidoreductase n=1 Tax=Sporomusa malonica TaxID=112901 RepID=A0A1W1ZX02_9FIRM|nr:FAD-dependent oxidoreductase [Sporomusa malonica]SMC52934.1 FAD dependent oxidoreductase [Sporomusa malonica]